VNRQQPILLAAALATASPLALAADIELFDWAFNIDGTFSQIGSGDPIPGQANVSVFDGVTGLGSIQVTLAGAGLHNVDLFVDHEIDQAINTFFNEYGVANNTAATGQSWEIDEPGWSFGDIYFNTEDSTLDNFNGVAAASPDDVSMALGWDFSLQAGETAVIDFILSDTAPGSGFYLQQVDPNSGTEIYFRSNLEIQSSVVPLPAAAWLFGSAMAGAVALGRRRRKNQAAK
jgi:hypothetical protein